MCPSAGISIGAAPHRSWGHSVLLTVCPLTLLVAALSRHQLKYPLLLCLFNTPRVMCVPCPGCAWGAFLIYLQRFFKFYLKFSFSYSLIFSKPAACIFRRSSLKPAPISAFNQRSAMSRAVFSPRSHLPMQSTLARFIT